VDLPLATQRRVESIASDRSPFAATNSLVFHNILLRASFRGQPRKDRYTARELGSFEIVR
jgi:hypothetical protein